MCGIVGARHDWLLAQGLDPARAMNAAVAAMAWRGPDGQAVEPAGPWWLGCARLAITQPNSRQPVVRRGGRFVGVMNGAITNARELWARLLPGAERRAAPPNDAWLPLLAVEQEDTIALHHLGGHHAYAVVDLHRGDVVLGRDCHGEKPLFCLIERVVAGWRLVAFASTLTALHHLGMPRKRSSRRLAEWFRFGWSPDRPLRLPGRRQLCALPTGDPLVPGEGSRAWTVPWGKLPRAEFAAANRRPTSGLKQDLIASVARCVDTAVPAALSLSGGLDSSCLALALAAAGHRVPAYQLRAEGTTASERDAATVVAARAGLVLRPVDVGIEVLDSLPFLTQCAGQPLGDPSILAVHAVARAAAADGVRVLLGGEGADEMFLGYRRYRALAHLPRARWLRPLAPRWSMRYAARLLRAIVAPDPIAALLAVTPPAFGDAALAPELAQRRCWRDAAHERLRRDMLMQGRLDDLFGYLRCDLLPKVDVATMAAGVEARCPYLEVGILSEPRVANLGKRELREAFAADLPPEVLRLPKQGFALPLDRWFRGDLPWLDLLAEPRTRERHHLRPDGVSRVVDLHRRGGADLGHGLYLLVACELFLRTLEDPHVAAGMSGRLRTDPGPPA